MKRVTLTRPLRKSSATASYVRVEKSKDNVREKSPLITLSLDRDSNKGLSPDRVSKSSGKNLVDVDEVLASLNPTQRKELLAKLALAAQEGATEANRDKDMWATAVYDGLTDAIGHEEGLGQGPALIRRTLGATQAWSPVEKFMEASRLNALKVTERQAVYRLLAKLVITQARSISQRSGAPLSAKLVGTVSANIASIFDQSFPSYLANGLAPIVAKRLLLPRQN